jgi:hypothetical protein
VSEDRPRKRPTGNRGGSSGAGGPTGGASRGSSGGSGGASSRGGRGRGGSSGSATGRPAPGARAGGQPGRGSRPDRADRPDRPDRPDRAQRPDGSAGGRTDRPPGAQRSERRAEPPLPGDVTGNELDRSVRAELASLASMNADTVARHLVMAGRLLDEDPEAAYLHATAAAQRAGRVGAVREAAGLAAYRSGRYAEALSELRAARRITGDNSFLPVMADCERGLGRPERAIEMAAGPEVARLDAASRVELLIVVSGARRDMGQPGAAVLALQGQDLRPAQRKPWSARLFYAYADALGEAGRADEAISWFEHAAAADTEGETDADLRLAELSGVTFVDADDGAED